MCAHKCNAEDRHDYTQDPKPTEGSRKHDGGTAEAEEGLTKAQICFLESCRPPQSKRVTLKFMEPSERPPPKLFSPMGHIPSPPSKVNKSTASQSPRRFKFKPTVSTISQPQVQHSVKLSRKLRWRSHLGSALLDEDPPDFRGGSSHMIRPYFYTVRVDPFLSPLRTSNNRLSDQLPRIPVIAPPRSCEKSLEFIS